MAETTSSQIMRFSVFEVDLKAGELRKNGVKIKLQQQPFQLLTILLRHPGEVVTREELRNKLWPEDTFVDFEHSVNAAIARLRDALGESADRPVFIETLPRRGYRFISTVVQATSAEGKLLSESAKGASRAAAAIDVVHRRRLAPVLGVCLAFFAVVGLIWTAVRLRRASSATKSSVAIQSLAVLPLENLSGDPAQEFFADGMTDELITDLGQIGSLRVISRTSSMTYKGAHKTVPEIARELNVEAVVEGTVTRFGERVRITAQLTKAPDDRQLWSQSYEGEARDVLKLQNQVASAIADQVRLKLTPVEKHALSEVRLVNPAAHDLYLRGFYEKPTVDGRKRSIEYFRQAIAIDPSYAAPYVGVADAYVRLGDLLALPPGEAFPIARQAGRKAVELDDTEAEAHRVLAMVILLYEWDFASAEKEFQKAIRLNPNSVEARADYAAFLFAMGRNDEAFAECERNLRNDPLSLRARTRIVSALYFSRKYDQAIAEGRRVLAIDPNRYDSHLWLGLSLEQKRVFPEALNQIDAVTKIWADKNWMGFIAHAKAVSGDKAGARRILAELESESQKTYVSPWLLAIVYPDLGEKDRAFYWLEKAYQGREHDVVFSKVWPMFDSLRDDPRFSDLMRRVGLPE